MKNPGRVDHWFIGAIAIVGFTLYFPAMGWVKPVRAQSAVAPAAAAGFNWTYELDSSAASLPEAQKQVASLLPGLASQGVTSQLSPLGGSMYRLTLTGDQGMEQLRQVLFSPLIADFIGGPAEVQINMPVGSLLDIPFKLESNLTTGYRWELLSSNGVDFLQAGESTYTIRSPGYGLPSVQTLVLHPSMIGDGQVHFLYRRSFGPVEGITRHLLIDLDAQALAIDLSNPHPPVIAAQTSSKTSTSSDNPIAAIPRAAVLPSSWDWRTAGILPAVRDQKGCGSCWAFGTVGVMESAILKAGGPLTDLSEQFLISCNKDNWNCEDGGWTAHKYHYDTLANNQSSIGAVLEADDPYLAVDGTCNVTYNHPYILSGWKFISGSDTTMPTVDQIKNAIYTYGPITAGVCADSGWNSYTGGVYNPSSNKCTGSTNHQIILVGWDDATSSWILRNSWGSSWGEAGYMRIHWDANGTTSHVGEGTSWVTWAGTTPTPTWTPTPTGTPVSPPTPIPGSFLKFMPLIPNNYSATPSGINNGDFEAGSVGWTEYSSHGGSIIGSSLPASITAHSGSHAAWLGRLNSDTSYIGQQITISAGAPYLAYWQWIRSADLCSYDVATVRVNGSVVDQYDLCSASTTFGWVTHSVDLHAYAGQSVALQIRVDTDRSITSDLLVDDVSLQSVAPTDAAGR